MALLDFLGKDVGGYAEGPNQTGNAGVGVSGINWGDLVGAAAKYGSTPGSSGPMWGNMMQQQYGAKPQGFVQGSPQIPDEQQQSNSTMPALQALAKYFGWAM